MLQAHNDMLLQPFDLKLPCIQPLFERLAETSPMINPDKVRVKVTFSVRVRVKVSIRVNPLTCSCLASKPYSSNFAETSPMIDPDKVANPDATPKPHPYP